LRGEHCAGLALHCALRILPPLGLCTAPALPIENQISRYDEPWPSGIARKGIIGYGFRAVKYGKQRKGFSSFLHYQMHLSEQKR